MIDKKKLYRTPYNKRKTALGSVFTERVLAGGLQRNKKSYTRLKAWCRIFCLNTQAVFSRCAAKMRVLTAAKKIPEYEDKDGKAFCFRRLHYDDK
jgi:hypothetical protein